jgi:hypothetical protein
VKSVGRVIFSDPFCASVAMLNGGTGPEALPKEISMPSGLSELSEPSNVSAPTASMTTSTPLPPVRSCTSAAQSLSR